MITHVFKPVVFSIHANEFLTAIGKSNVKATNIEIRPAHEQAICNLSVIFKLKLNLMRI